MTKVLNISKKFMIGILTVLMVLALMGSTLTTAFALDRIEDQDVTLAAQFTGEAAHIAGIDIKAYKIASVTDSLGYVVTDTFASYPLDFNNIHEQGVWSIIATTLSAYIQRDKIEADYTAMTDENGRADFGDVERGLYLIMGDGYRKETEEVREGVVYKSSEEVTITPSLLLAPSPMDDGSWNYDFEFSPKYNYDKKSSDLPSTPGEEKVDISVIKIWKNETDQVKRPAKIEVELLCNGSVKDTVELNKENGWKYTWTELEKEGMTYSVLEKVVPTGYTVATTIEGTTFTITNSGSYKPPTNPPTTPPTTPPRLPQTGVPWVPAIALGGSGIVFIGLGLARRGRKVVD